ncbi:unnamed protein product [Porites evermanni]|uniref:CHAT domain-containing protein n=1 Tax=Porites evermanni TaxID=104178 RepID=A0ABN8MQY8_9CNID|nr:unnamed protein product [Porites evermanni]
MEYLVKKHQCPAIDGLLRLRDKLPCPEENVIEDFTEKMVKTKEFSFPCLFEIAQEYTNRSLPTAERLWDKLIVKAENTKPQKFMIMSQLFHVQVQTGPWNVAFETAKKMYDETMEYCKDQRKTIEADPLLTEELLFNASLNLGSIHRLRKELNTAEHFYKKAMESATLMKDLDREMLAKIHLALCLLDRGELKEAMENYFKELMISKSNMSNYTKTLFLQYYGNACRSAADWGRAKEYLREALHLAKQLKDAGLVSSCCGDLGNVFRSEGRYWDAEQLHGTHCNIALKRGDIHGLAIACGNIGFLKFYNPQEADASVVYQFIEYSLAGQLGDFARMGIAFNKIGKLYTTLGYYDPATELFQVALDTARKAGNVAGEGMAWGNLGNVYRALAQFEKAIECLNFMALLRLRFQTLESIRSQIGKEDQSKLSNFEKNQGDACNLLQMVLVAQKKYKEAFVFADASRGRALAEIVRNRLWGSISSLTDINCLREEFTTQSFQSLLQVSRKLSTALVMYSLVKEFDRTGAIFNWVYAWVLHPTGSLDFSKTPLQSGTDFKVEVNDEFIFKLRSSMAQQSQREELSQFMSCKNTLHLPLDGQQVQPRTNIQTDEVLESLRGLDLFPGFKCESKDNGNSFFYHPQWDCPADRKTDSETEKGRQDPLQSSCNNDLEGNHPGSDHTDLNSGETSQKSCTTQSETKAQKGQNVAAFLTRGNDDPPPTTQETRNDLNNDPVLAPWQPMLCQLYKILIAPIANVLPREDKKTRIIFIPQDFLLKVPFAALREDANHPYLMENYVISTSPSIHLLELSSAICKSSEDNASLELSLLAVGNPKMPFERYLQLPFAEREVHLISKIINSEASDVLTGEKATKRNVVAAMPKHKILHFATHAVVENADSHGDFSMPGFIVLAKSDSNCDGILKAEEVREMKLNAELVVLSCCETGLGKVTGDGILGLARAFLASGAACVITTLWKIDDQSASELMAAFYQEYKSSRDAASSLQRAMNILQSKDDTKSPQHWGAFSIVGTTGFGSGSG